jgi:hypothetical protein
MLTRILSPQHSSYVCLLLNLLAATVLAQGHEKAHFDVLFPREGGVYKNVFPFPVVLSYRNIDKLWPAFLCVGWSEFTRMNGGRQCLDLDSQGKWTRPPNGTLIESVWIGNSTDQWFELVVDAELTNICDLGRDTPRETRIRFRISESGEQPDIAAELSKCPTAVWAASIEGRKDAVLPQRFGSSCPVLATTEAENCLLQDEAQELARQVAEEMVMVASCRYSGGSRRYIRIEDGCSRASNASRLEKCPANLTWPSSDLVKPCIFENGATASRSSGSVTLLILLTAAASLLGAT